VIKFQLLIHYNISTDAWLTTPNVVLDVVVYSSKVSVSNLVCHINIKETFSSVCHLSQQYFSFQLWCQVHLVMDIPGACTIHGVPDPGKPGHSEMCCIQTPFFLIWNLQCRKHNLRHTLTKSMHPIIFTPKIRLIIGSVNFWSNSFSSLSQYQFLYQSLHTYTL